MKTTTGRNSIKPGNCRSKKKLACETVRGDTPSVYISSIENKKERAQIWGGDKVYDPRRPVSPKLVQISSYKTNILSDLWHNSVLSMPIYFGSKVDPNNSPCPEKKQKKSCRFPTVLFDLTGAYCMIFNKEALLPFRQIVHDKVCWFHVSYATIQECVLNCILENS